MSFRTNLSSIFCLFGQCTGSTNQTEQATYHIQNGMTCRFHCECPCHVRSDVVSQSDNVAERRQHVEHPNSVTHPEYRLDLRPYPVEEVLNHLVSAYQGFGHSILQTCIQLLQAKRQTFEEAFLLNPIHQHIGDSLIVKVDCSELEPVLPAGVILQLRCHP